MSTTAKIGIAVAITVAVVLIIVAAIWALRRRRMANRQHHQRLNEYAGRYEPKATLPIAPQEFEGEGLYKKGAYAPSYGRHELDTPPIQSKAAVSELDGSDRTELHDLGWRGRAEEQKVLIGDFPDRPTRFRT